MSTEKLQALVESAVSAMQAISGADTRNVGVSYFRRIADDWLLSHGYEGGHALRARKEREVRAEYLDREIERMRAERAKL